MKKRYLTTLLLIFVCVFQIHFLQAQNECFTIQLSSETGQVGDTIAVDLSVKDFNDIIGMQFTIEWNTLQLGFLKVADFNLQDLDSLAFGPLDPGLMGYLTHSWIDLDLGGVTVPDGTVICRLYFEVLYPGTTAISFVQSPTSVEFTHVDEFTLTNFSTIGGQIISSEGPISISPLVVEMACVNSNTCLNFGTVIVPEISGGEPPYTYQWTGPNNYSSNTQNLTGIAQNGYYSLRVIDNTGHSVFSKFRVFLTNTLPDPVSYVTYEGICMQNNGSIRISPTNSMPNYAYLWNTGATTAELTNLSIGSYAVTITDEDGCMQEEAFDLTYERLSAFISTQCDSPTDIELSSLTTGSGTSPYTYVWSTGDTTITNSSQETTTITVSEEGNYGLTVTDASGVCQKIFEDYYADCSNDYDLEIYFNPAEDSLEIGDQFCLDIKVNDFIDIIGMQASINWDSDAFQFNNITLTGDLPGLTLAGFGTPPSTAEGVVTFSWVEETLYGLTLSDSTTMFQLCLTVLPGAAGANTIEFSDNPVATRFTSIDEYELLAINSTATVYVGNWDGVTEIELLAGQGSVTVNESVCIPISVNEFYNITDLQFSLNWDPMELSFTHVQNLNLPNLTMDDFDLVNAPELGQLGVNWTNNSAINLVNSTEIFDVCFQAIGNTNGTAISFGNSPLSISANAADNSDVIVNTADGIVSINGIVTWPGDTDMNERVDNGDLLNMGLAFGETGPARLNTSIDWQEYPVAEWNYHTPNSNINGAHVDADGNGLIDQVDVLAIEQNYGEETNFWNDADEHRSPILPEALTLTEATLMVETQTINPGQETTFNVLFGDETTPAENIYGLAFTIVYDPTAVVGGSLSTSFVDSWLGDENNDLITIYHERPDDHRIDIAICRTNHENQSGFGAIAQLNLTIAELIQEENYAMAFDIEDVRIINADEEVIPSVQPTTYSEILGTTDTHSPELANQVSIFPVPARDFLQIRTGALTVETTSLYTIDGKFIRQWNGNPQEISTAALEAGTYVLKLSTREGTIHKRFVKTR